MDCLVGLISTNAETLSGFGNTQRPVSLKIKICVTHAGFLLWRFGAPGWFLSLHAQKINGTFVLYKSFLYMYRKGRLGMEATMVTGKKKIGRPVKPAAPGSRVPLGLRVTADVKSRLDGAAEASGRSQSQEAELRLERSFHEDDAQARVIEMLGGPEIFRLLTIIGGAMSKAGRTAALLARHKPIQDWASHPYAYDQAMKAAVAVLEGLRPPGEIREPELNAAEIVGEMPIDMKQLQALVPDVGARQGRKAVADATNDKESES